MEPIKESFLRRNFGNDTGSLYEGTLSYLATNYLDRFEPKTDLTNTEKENLIALIEALDSPDEELVQNLSEHLNIDLYIRFWALEMVSSHIDGYSANQNNFYIYFEPANDNRAVFIPWGADKTFVSHDDDKVFSSYQYLRAKIPRRLAGIPEIRQQMEAEVNRVLDEVWDTEAFLDSIDNYESLIIEHSDYYFNIAEEFSQPIDTEQDYRDVMVELRLFVREQPEMVLENLEPMFELAKEPGVYEQPAGEQGFFANLNWGKLMDENAFPDSGLLGGVFSRLRHDMGTYGTGGETKALPTDWLIVMPLIWDETPNLIIIALALVILIVMKGFQRKY